MKGINLAASALLAFATPAVAQWSENFDSYSSSTVLDNVGGWFGWDNASGVAGTADGSIWRSGPNSLLCDGAAQTDAIHPGLGITSGKWRITAWQYIAAPLTGDVYFILNSVYNHGGPYTWTTQLHCSGGSVTDDLRSATPQPLVIGQWIEFRADIDLDADTVAYYYNGALISQGLYTIQGGPAVIENIDLYSSGGTCHWDDIVLQRRAPRDVVAFDVDNDKQLELATANNGTNDVSLYPNLGAGVFGPDFYVAVTPADQGVIALAAGDLDGDGAADDLAVACATSNTVCTILDPNVPAPTLTSLPIPGIVSAADVAVATLDAGTVADVVVACQGDLFGSGGIAVSLDGGAFAVISGAGAYVKVAAADLDGDGDVDIAAVVHGSPDRIDLFENDGSGAFTAAGSIMLSTSGFAGGLCARDLDGVNGNDLVSLTPNPLALTNEFNVHANTGSGPLGAARFSLVGPFATPGQFAFDVGCGDFEQDTVICGGTVLLNRMDICIVNAGLGAPISHHGFDGSTFASSQVRAAGAGPIACVVADLNDDGNDDLAIANQGSGEVTVTLSPATPLADPFGTGCPGTGAQVPVIGSSGGLPVLGSNTFAVTLSQALNNALAGLVFSFSCNNLPIGGCTIYVGLPSATTVIAFADNAGNATVPLSIPNVVSLLSVDVFAQWAVFDPNGTYANVLAFSPGLHIQIGQ